MSPSANIAFPRDRSNPRSSFGADATGAADGGGFGGMGACSVAPSTDTADTGGGDATGAVAADRTCGEVVSTSSGVATGGNETIAGCCDAEARLSG